MSFKKNKNKTGFLAYENSSGIIKNCNLLQSTSNVQLNYLKFFFIHLSPTQVLLIYYSKLFCRSLND